MKSIFYVSLLSILTLCSCSGKTETTTTASADAAEQAAVPNVKGQWEIQNIVLDDSTSVRPSEVAKDVSASILFEDDTYYVNTGCNSISGMYVQKGDSITLCDGMMTEMACENMETEDAMRKILPNIKTISVENDSVARLNGSSPSEYIIIKK